MSKSMSLIPAAKRKLILATVFIIVMANLFMLLQGVNAAQTLPTTQDCALANSRLTNLLLIEEGERTAETIASGFPDPSEALLLLRGWGFVSNRYWNYATPAGTATESGTTSLEMSAHVFVSANSAAAAMIYYAQGRSEALELVPIQFPALGDRSTAIGGIRDVGLEVTVYMQVESLLVRISAVAPLGDPASDVIAAAISVICAAIDSNQT